MPEGVPPTTRAECVISGATVSMVHGDASFMMKTTDGKDIAVATNASTAYFHADGTTATRADLATGMRVVVKLTLDGKTAASVKMSK